MLEKGGAAPDFTLKNQQGEDITLSSFLGKKVVLYFYPKDNTPGCTKEACSLRDSHSQILEKGAVILGVSPDSGVSHQRFREKYNLPFHLLSDEDKSVLKLYEAWGEKRISGKSHQGVLRSTYILDEQGKILAVFQKVNTSRHGEEVLAVL